MICLESEPKELLRSYPPTDESYLLALGLESVRGGEKRRVSQGIRNGKIIDGEDLTALRRFIMTLEGSLLTIKGANDDNEALLQLAEERLSRDLLRRYVQWTLIQKVSQSFKSLNDFLSERIIIEEAPEVNTKAKLDP